MTIPSPYGEWSQLTNQQAGYLGVDDSFTKIFQYAEGGSTTAGGGAAFLNIPGSKATIPVPKGYARFPGIVDVGTTTYSGPGWMFTGGGRLISTSKAARIEMGQAVADPGGYLKKMGASPVYDSTRQMTEAIKLASQNILSRGRSVAESRLGFDQSLAFYRSHQYNINNLRFAMPETTLAGETLAAGSHRFSAISAFMGRATRKFQMGGTNLRYGPEIESFWAGMLGRLEGLKSTYGPTLYASGMKDTAARGAGLLSSLSATDVSFHATPGIVGKSVHGWHKTQAFPEVLLQESGLGVPAAAGAAMEAESSWFTKFNHLQRGTLRGYSGTYRSRFGAQIFLSMGVVGKGGGLVPSGRLADSRAFGDQHIFNLTKFQGMTQESKEILLGGAIGKNYSALDLHKELQGDVTALLKGMKGGRVSTSVLESLGMRQTATGDILYNAGKAISRSGQYADKIDFFLGSNMPANFDLAKYNQDDIQRMLVGAEVHGGTANIKGYRIGAKGGLKLNILYDPSSQPMMNAAQTQAEIAMMGGSRRLMVQAGMRDAFQTTAGKRFNLLARGQEYGLSSGGITDDFLTYVLSGMGEEAKAAGKLKAFHKFLGGADSGLKYTNFGGGQIGWSDTTKGAGENLQKLLLKVSGATPQQAAALGLDPHTASMLTSQGGKLALNPAAQQTFTDPVSGEVHKGYVVGAETAFRSGQVRHAKFGRLGARMADVGVLLQQQASGVAGTSIAPAYQQLLADFKTMAQRGNLDHNALGRTNISAASEIKGIARSLAGFKAGSYTGTGTHSGGVAYAGGQMKFADWLRGGNKPLGSTLQAANDIMSAGPITQFQAQGTIHGLGASEIIELPKAISYSTVGGVRQTKFIPLPSNAFLGVSPTNEGMFFGNYSRGASVVALKERAAALLTEHGSAIAAGNMPENVNAAVARYLSNLSMGMGMKKGFGYHSAVANLPSVSGNVVNYGSIESGLTQAQRLTSIGMSPKMASRFLHQSGFRGAKLKSMIKGLQAGTEKFAVGGFRYPLHHGGNIGWFNLRVHDMVDDVLALSRTFVEGMAEGDFDKDTFQAFVLNKDKNKYLQDIVRHREGVMSGYAKVLQARESAEYARMGSALAAGNLAVEDKFFKFFGMEGAEGKLKAQFVEAMSGRMRGAAGGGVFTAGVHQGYAGLTYLTASMQGAEGQGYLEMLYKGGQEDLARQVSALQRDKGFTSVMGTTQVAGVMGTLKKGSSSDATLGLVSGLTEYRGGKISLGELKGLTERMFTQASKSGQLPLSEVQAMGMSGITAQTPHGQIGKMMAARAFGEGLGHEGLGTVAKMDQFLRGEGVMSGYQMFRGTFPAGTNDEAYFIKSQQKVIENLLAQEGGAVPGVNVGTGGPATAAAKSEILTRAMIEEAELNGRSLASRVAGSTSGPSPDTIRGLRGNFAKAASGKWGKIMLGAGAIIMGVGALDAVFGDDGDDPMSSAYGGAPLPPTMGIGVPDGGMGVPSAESFASRAQAPARIERPYAQRQQFNINGTAGDHADFGYLTHGYQGSVGMVNRDGYIHDGSSRDLDLEYMIRSRLNSSF